MKSNPNILEILGSNMQFCHPLFKKYILDNKHLFLSKLCRDTFAGYAVSQIKKAKGLNKKIVNPMSKEKKDLLDFCFVIDNDKTYPLKKLLQERKLIQLFCGVQKLDHAQDIFAVYYDKMGEKNFIDNTPETLRHREANKIEGNIMGYGFKGIVNTNDPVNTTQIRLSSIPEIKNGINDHLVEFLCLISYNQAAYSRYCLDYNSYWTWVRERNEARYLSNMEHGGEIDYKNMNHTIRLLNTCLDLFKTGEVIVKRPEREFLLDIRNGKYSYNEILEMAESRLKEIDKLVKYSTLPDTPDENKLNELLISFRKEFKSLQ